MHVLGDSWTAVAYFSASLLIAALLWRWRNRHTRALAIVLIAFMLTCGLTHIAEFILSGEPMASLQAAIELMAAAIAVAATTLLWSETPVFSPLPTPVDLAEENADLKAEIERRQMNEDFLRHAHLSLEQQVETATKALSLAYAKLNANRQRLAFALEGANDGLWDWQLDQNSIYFSARLGDMLGYPPKEMTLSVARRWALIHRDDRAAALEAFNAHLDGKTPLYESEHRVRTRQGEHIWVLDRGKVVERDPFERPVRAVGTTANITRRKNAELALQASNGRVKRLYEQTPAMLYSVDADGRLLTVTNHWLETMGYSRDEVLGRRSIEFMTEESRRYVTETALPLFRQQGVIHDVACQMTRKNGEVFDVLLSATSEHDRTGRVLRSLAVLVDITERNRALRQLEESEARLRLALEGAREGLWDWNLGSGELYLSPQAGAILGFAADELPTDPGFWHDLLPEDDRERFAAGLADLGSGKVTSLVSELELRPSGQTPIWIDWRASSVEPANDGAARRIVGIFRDITARKRAELQTAHRALHDSLTGLPNRMAYEEQLQRSHADAELSGRQLAVMFLDLDRFKAVNDSFGHDCGDRLLIEAGRRLQRCLRKTDLVARFGGDEFALLARDYQAPGDIDRLAARIIKTIAEPIHINGQQIEIGVSIGITSFPEDRSPANVLVANADLALYRAKKAGRGTWQRYHPSMPSRRHSPPPTADAVLYDALRAGEFEMYYQPIIDVDDFTVSAIEAMVCWHNPVRGRLRAAEFMPEILNSPFLRCLVEWSLQSATTQLATWRDLGLAPTIALAIDLPTPMLHAHNLLDAIERPLTQMGIDPASLVIELAESALADDIAGSGVLEALNARGIKIAIDEFGAGYASLGRLRSLPIDQLKIHGGFVAGMTSHDQDAAVVASIAAIAANLNMTSIANEVETADQLAAITRLGCRYLQGAFVAPPAKAGETSQWLSRWRERCRHDQGLDLLRRG